MRKRYYLGRPKGFQVYDTPIVFASAETPTQATHGDRFVVVTGPFRDKRAAEWAAARPAWGVTTTEANRATKRGCDD